MSGPNTRVVAATRKASTSGVFPKIQTGTKRKVPAQNPVKQLPDHILVQGFTTIEECATKLGLGRLDSPRIFVGTDQKSNSIGNKSLRNSTLDRYFAALPGFIKYCILVGDPQSAIMVHIPGCCEHPCPPSESTYLNYARYHVLVEGTILKDYKTEAPVLFNGQPVRCLGDWRSKETVGIYRSAIGLLSKEYVDCSGDYEGVCTMCAELPPDAERGCLRRGHISPRLLPRGNVTRSPDSAESFKSLEAYIESHYTVKSTVALLPSELRKIRDRCLSGNHLGELMVWVVFLLSTRQYLRSTEVLMLKVEDWDLGCAKVSETDVISLLLSVLGKRDTGKSVNLACWTDPECPEFSAATVVLIWISLTGITSGYMFPPIEMLCPGKTPSQEEEYYSYHHYLTDLKYLTVQVAGRDLFSEVDKEVLLVGTHVGRKTGAQLSAFGFLSKNSGRQTGLEDPIFLAALKNDLGESTGGGNLRLDMRHEGLGGTMIYIADAATLYQYVSTLEGAQKVSLFLPFLRIDYLFADIML
jgi:hypothetical protein